MTRMAGVRPADFTDEYVADVCKPGQGEAACRYLTISGDGWGCEKRTSLRHAIDGRAATMTAQGDNCDGRYEPTRAWVLLADRFGHLAGTTVYEAKGWDYGLAADDAAITGEPHTSVTLEPSGDYPTFTVRDEDLGAVPAQETA